MIRRRDSVSFQFAKWLSLMTEIRTPEVDFEPVLPVIAPFPLFNTKIIITRNHSS